MKKQKLLLPCLCSWVASAAFVMLSGCGGGSSGGTAIPVEPRILQSNVSMLNRVPPVGIIDAGRLIVQITEATSPLKVTLEIPSASILRSPVTDVSLRAGKRDENGPVLFRLYSPSDGVFPAELIKELTPANFQPARSAGIDSFQDAVRRIANGETYVEVSTQSHPTGAIRGQIGQDRLATSLGHDGSMDQPFTAARGEGDVYLNAARRYVELAIHLTLVSDVTGIELHYGDRASEGRQASVLFVLSPAIDGDGDKIAKTLTAKEFHPAPSKGLNTFDDCLALMSVASSREGDQFFINVRTKSHPNGEIRGFIFQNRVYSTDSVSRFNLR